MRKLPKQLTTKIPQGNVEVFKLILKATRKSAPKLPPSATYNQLTAQPFACAHQSHQYLVVL